MPMRIMEGCITGLEDRH